MLIPSIDLQGGRIVQLVQGRRLALASDDVSGWIERFRGFERVQLIDLDAALEEGGNDDLVRRICRELPCRVGGGVRSVTRAEEVLAAGAVEVIVGSALFRPEGIDVAFAERLAEAIGRARVTAAVDSAGGRVVTRGWRHGTGVTAVAAVRQLEPWCGGFLYTHVETEGLMQGIDMDAVRTVRDATTRRLSAAGGITTREDVEALDAMGVDSVVGMAIYTGRLSLDDRPGASGQQP